MTAKSITSLTTSKQDSIDEIMNRKEDLNPELAKYIIPGGPLGPMLKHPLVIDIAYTPQLNAMYNERLKAKKEYIDEKIKKQDWSSVLWMHERPYRFDVFMKYMDKMPAEQYWELLRHVWEDTENLWQYKSIVPHLLTARKGCRQMMDSHALELFKKLPKEIVVYRGYQTRNRQGFAWSLSHGKALWFAKRFEQPRYNVVRGILQKSDVFAVMTGRNEYEVIAFPECVKKQQVMKPLERPSEVAQVLAHTVLEFQLPKKRSVHGADHWERVERNVVAICAADPKADELVCRLFAVCHDCKRENENEDPKHGHRAAEWIMGNLHMIPVKNDRLEKLLEACRYHNDGQVSTDPTIGACWDADRLDLPRVGITPDPKYLSTATAKKLMWKI